MQLLLGGGLGGIAYINRPFRPAPLLSFPVTPAVIPGRPYRHSGPPPTVIPA